MAAALGRHAAILYHFQHIAATGADIKLAAIHIFIPPIILSGVCFYGFILSAEGAVFCDFLTQS
jgi:hypothetical protein